MEKKLPTKAFPLGINWPTQLDVFKFTDLIIDSKYTMFVFRLIKALVSWYIKFTIACTLYVRNVLPFDSSIIPICGQLYCKLPQWFMFVSYRQDDLNSSRHSATYPIMVEQTMIKAKKTVSFANITTPHMYNRTAALNKIYILCL